MNPIPRQLWRVAGVLAIAHVVLIPISLALEMPALFSDGADGIADAYGDGNMALSFTGGVIESVAFLMLIPVLVFLGRVLGRGSELGGWAAQTGVICGAAYVAVTFAVGFPGGAAAMYGVQHGLDLEAALAINNLRNFAYFLSLLLLGGSTLGFSVAALAEGVHRRWWGLFGSVTSVALLASTPLAALQLHDWGVLVWMVWFLGAGVLMVRHVEDRADAVVPQRERVRSGTLEPR
ncbi:MULTISPECIES: hypothetical protein [unclassified Nocardioides]|uniref:hypothetical protein n=1 Tax=unclassified Nocardioides TaxID=2615069 RepID=UPI00360FB873